MARQAWSALKLPTGLHMPHFHKEAKRENVEKAFDIHQFQCDHLKRSTEDLFESTKRSSHHYHHQTTEEFTAGLAERRNKKPAEEDTEGRLGLVAFDANFDNHFSLSSHRIQHVLQQLHRLHASNSVLEDNNVENNNVADNTRQADETCGEASKSTGRSNGATVEDDDADEEPDPSATAPGDTKSVVSKGGVLMGKTAAISSADEWVYNARLQPELWGMRVRFFSLLWEFIEEDLIGYSSSHMYDEDNNHVCIMDNCMWKHEKASVVSREEARGSLRPMPIDMHLVVQRYVKPWTVDTYVGLSLLFNTGFRSAHRTEMDYEDLCKAQVFISHSWAGEFEYFKGLLERSLSMETVVWVCSMALWQHGAIGDHLSDVTASPFARALNVCDRILACTSAPVKFYERCWCVFEAALSLEWNKEYHISMPENGSTAYKETLDQLETLDLADCQASVPDDKIKIMDYAIGHLGGVDSINHMVRGVARDAIQEALFLSAASSGNVQMLRHFAGSDERLKNWRSVRGRGVLHLMAASSQVMALSTVLGIIGANQLDIQDASGQTPLAVATQSGSIAGVAALTNLNADVNAPSEGDLRPLHYAVERGNAKIAQLLLSAQAYPEAEACYLGTGGRRPLCVAVREGHLDCVSTLISARVEVNVPSSNGVRPLFLAAGRGYPDLIAALIDARAEINARNDDKWGRTALTRAMLNGHMAAVAMLVAAQADPNIKDNAQVTCASLAFEKNKGNEHVAKLFRQIKRARNKDLSFFGNVSQAGHVAGQKGKAAVVKAAQMASKSAQMASKMQPTPHDVAARLRQAGRVGRNVFMSGMLNRGSNDSLGSEPDPSDFDSIPSKSATNSANNLPSPQHRNMETIHSVGGDDEDSDDDRAFVSVVSANHERVASQIAEVGEAAWMAQFQDLENEESALASTNPSRPKASFLQETPILDDLHHKRISRHQRVIWI